MEYEGKEKPCPFCGSTHLDYSYKTDKKKILGHHWILATLYCRGCGCTFTCAGENEETAKKYCLDSWNKRVYDNGSIL